MTDRWYIKEDGSNLRTPISGFDEDGYPTVPDIDRHGRPVTWTFRGQAQDIDREGPIIPAGPGWYVLYGSLDEHGSLSMNRCPVIAWEARNNGDAFIASDMCLDSEGPVASVMNGFRMSGYFPFAIYHGVYREEPETIEADLLAFVEQEIKHEHARTERWAEQQARERRAEQ